MMSVLLMACAPEVTVMTQIVVLERAVAAIMIAAQILGMRKLLIVSWVIVHFIARMVLESLKMRVADGTGAFRVQVVGALPVMRMELVTGIQVILARAVVVSRKQIAVTVRITTAMAGLTAVTGIALTKAAAQTYSAVLEYANKITPTVAVQCILILIFVLQMF